MVRICACLEILSNLANEALERELADEELRRLLVATNLAQCNSAGTEAMRLLHATSCWLEKGYMSAHSLTAQ